MSISLIEIAMMIIIPLYCIGMCYFAFIHGPRELEKRNKKDKKK
jgi:hypothetical protein|tara:strand:+ start:449 stop:580 length:132 start_codon:yes stop_codon:yes gene_type:complete